MKENCEKSRKQLNEDLAKRKEEKVNSLKPCGEEVDPCSCGGGIGGESKVDLVVLIDASGSMRNAIDAVSAAAPKALDKAKGDCEADVDAKWFLVDSAKPGFNLGSLGVFSNTHQHYLSLIGATGPFYHDVPDTPGSLWT